jgi:translation initiation factor 4G
MPGTHNQSNGILLRQGLFTSLPWGIIFVFLNDYLSQEKGFSVPDATVMVMLFGIGCAIGGIFGGSDPTTL